MADENRMITFQYARNNWDAYKKQTIPNILKCMTKNDINTYLNADMGVLSSYLNNQLVPRNKFFGDYLIQEPYDYIIVDYLLPDNGRAPHPKTGALIPDKFEARLYFTGTGDYLASYTRNDAAYPESLSLAGSSKNFNNSDVYYAFAGMSKVQTIESHYFNLKRFKDYRNLSGVPRLHLDVYFRNLPTGNTNFTIQVYGCKGSIPTINTNTNQLEVAIQYKKLFSVPAIIGNYSASSTVWNNQNVGWIDYYTSTNTIKIYDGAGNQIN